MKDRKNILIIVLFIVLVILTIFVYIKKSKSTIYLGYYTKVTIKDNKINVVKKNSKLNLTKAKIYFNDDFVDGYLKSSKSKQSNGVTLYNAYNEEGTILRFTNDLIAYTGKSSIKIANANILNKPINKDLSIITDFLNGENGNGISLDYSYDYEDYKKIIYDFDNDGENETIYSLDIIEGSTTEYTYVFLVDGEKIELIDSKKGEITKPDLKKISFFNLIDFNGDGKYEIVLKLSTGDYGYNYYKIYSYDNKVKEIE